MLVVFGAINVDFIFPVAALPATGETIWAAHSRAEPGGKGGNQAVAAARDGARVRLVGAVGHDPLADMALGGLARAGVDLRHVIRTDADTGRSMICVDPSGYTRVIADRGANSFALASQVPAEALGSATTLLLQMDNDPVETAALIMRARREGARIILNMSPPRLIDADALRAVDVLIANSQELAWVGERLGTGNNPASIQASLGVTTVRMIGVQGAELMSDDGFLQMPAMPVDMRDTTAAADCFTGVFAVALSRGYDLGVAMRRAAVAAALSTTRLGAQGSMPEAREIDAALREAPQPTSKQSEVID